ncbi:RCC1 repeat-containing protein, partial [Candidatus Saccharibacteria bacterium]|nr:RCC1 repeat-containing protein [Candidatus Saccharibacteria bacterium]
TAGVLSGKTVSSIASGNYGVCAIASDNNAYCWGLNDRGELGNGTWADSYVPTAVSTSGVLSGKTIHSMYINYTQSCAIASDNNAYCWGENAYGQLGNGNTTPSNIPVSISIP